MAGRSFFTLLGLTLLTAVGCTALDNTPPSSEIAAIEAVLDDFHDAAARGDGPCYFGLLAPDAVFMGTDPGERWTKEAFQAWAAPYFEGDSAWIFVPRDRFVFLGEGGITAWFDEVVESEHYGACRGTGTLVKQGGTWKIAHYNLTLPIPNDLMKEVVRMIGQAEERDR
jgi:ketosteroid isomerase-like protein